MRETDWMCFSQYLALLESLFLLSLAKFENVTSHRIARGKITRQNATIVHRVGSQNSPQGTFKSAIFYDLMRGT